MKLIYVLKFTIIRFLKVIVCVTLNDILESYTKEFGYITAYGQNLLRRSFSHIDHLENCPFKQKAHHRRVLKKVTNNIVRKKTAHIKWPYCIYPTAILFTCSKNFIIKNTRRNPLTVIVTLL